MLEPSKCVEGLPVRSDLSIDAVVREIRPHDIFLVFDDGSSGWYGKGFVAENFHIRTYDLLGREPEEPKEAATTEAPESASASTASSSGCLRVAAVREEWEFERDHYVNLKRDGVISEPEEEIANFMLLADRWRPRLPEFEPCGGCAWCDNQIKEEEEMAARDKFCEEHCFHGWRVGTACPDCPGGRACDCCDKVVPRDLLARVSGNPICTDALLCPDCRCRPEEWEDLEEEERER